MCYSAQVVESARKLQRELTIDWNEALGLALRRLKDRSIVISRGFEENFAEPKTDIERQIKSAIDEYRAQSATKYEADLFAQKTRLNKAERALKEKETKKAREDVRIASKKIESLTAKLSDLRRTEPKARDSRIFPFQYAGVIVMQEGKEVLTPMRYFCRPAGKPSFYDRKFPGLYNARRDNIEKFWKEQFGHTHAILAIEGFYENVPLHKKEHRELKAGEESKNLVLHFRPSPPQMMHIACVWSRWEGDGEVVNGFAAITDEPPPEVAAAGHDRCVIHIDERRIDEWLTPEGRSREELQAILDDRPKLVFEHQEVKAA